MKILFYILLLASLGLAQTADTDVVDTVAPDEIPVYLPGGDEAGPTLPSRRGIDPVYNRERLMKIRPFLGIQGVYDTGLTPVVTDENGNLLNEGAYGAEFRFGVAGSRAFRHSLVNLRYSGNLRHYPDLPFMSTTNHMMELGFQHMFSRRLSLNSVNQAGLRNDGFMGQLGGFASTGDSALLPTDDMFNNPVLYANTNQQLVYQKSARLSFSGGGGGFTQRRRSNALVSVQGAQAAGGIAYRLNSRKTLGLNYGFNQFNFNGGYGGSGIHMLSVEYAHQFARRTSVTLTIGGSRVESQSLQRVVLDPVLAELLGQSAGTEAVYRKNYLPTYGASFRHGFRSGTFQASGSRSVTPGNGLMLTSVRTNYSSSYHFTGIRRWTLSLSGNYSELNGLKGAVSRFTTFQGGMGVTYKIANGLSWSSSLTARKFILDEIYQGSSRFDRPQYRVSTGINWSPDDLPMRFF